MFDYRKLLSLVFIMFGVVLFSFGTVEAKQKKLTMVYVEWDCATSTSYLVKAALEEKMNIKVDLLSVGAASMWASIASGDADVSVAMWLPLTHGSYAKRLEGKYEELGTVASGARVGWAVPDYVKVNSIEELGKYKKEFQGRIIGIDAGAGLMESSEKAMKEYKLNSFDLIDGSGATMTASLQDAIKRKEWIVVTAWSPHWKFGRWDLHYLEDPKGIFGKGEDIRSVGRLGLDKDMPEIHAFFKNFHFESIAQLQGLMEMNQVRGADFIANAKIFMQKNPELVAKWFAK